MNARKTLTAVPVVGVVVALAVPAQAAILLHHWDFSETNGTAVTDKEGSRDGTFAAANGDLNVTGAPGFGSGLYCNGGGKAVTLDDMFASFSDMFGSDYNYTITMWVKRTGAASVQRLFGGYGTGGGASTATYSTGIDLNAGNYRAATYHGGTSAYPSAMFPADTWMHVAFAIEDVAGTSETEKVYIDGDLEGTGTMVDWDNAAYYHVGARGSGAQAFTGYIDELKVWDTTMDEAEVEGDMIPIPEPATLLVMTAARLPLLLKRRRSRG